MLRKQTHQPVLKMLLGSESEIIKLSQITSVFSVQNQMVIFMTLHADENILCKATDLEDTALLARIASGDSIAIKANYHLPCLFELRNRLRCLSRQQRR